MDSNIVYLFYPQGILIRMRLTRTKSPMGEIQEPSPGVVETPGRSLRKAEDDNDTDPPMMYVLQFMTIKM